jgi:ABC-type polysaccharide/polyol phosphate export permease
MVGIVLNTRAVLLEGNPVQWELAWVNLGTATLLTIVANLVFKKTAKKIVEHG